MAAAFDTYSDDSDYVCPLCMEEMDLTDRKFQPCHCGYQICLWCFHQILELATKDNIEGRCPACRTSYDKDKIVSGTPDPEELADMNDKKQKASKNRNRASEGRKHLSNVRVVQRNLVYVVGFPISLADEELLEKKEHFGQYGKIMKIALAKNNYSSQHVTSPSISVYVTYFKEEDALRCIQTVDGCIFEGRSLRACFGTTKYCNAWLKNMPCNNPDCLYLHEVGTPEDSFTKEEMIAKYGSKHNPYQDSYPPIRRLGEGLPPPIDAPVPQAMQPSIIPIASAPKSAPITVPYAAAAATGVKPSGLPPQASWASKSSAVGNGKVVLTFAKPPGIATPQPIPVSTVEKHLKPAYSASNQSSSAGTSPVAMNSTLVAPPQRSISSANLKSTSQVAAQSCSTLVAVSTSVYSSSSSGCGVPSARSSSTTALASPSSQTSSSAYLEPSGSVSSDNRPNNVSSSRKQKQGKLSPPSPSAAKASKSDSGSSASSKLSKKQQAGTTEHGDDAEPKRNENDDSNLNNQRFPSSDNEKPEIVVKGYDTEHEPADEVSSFSREGTLTSSVSVPVSLFSLKQAESSRQASLVEPSPSSTQSVTISRVAKLGPPPGFSSRKSSTSFSQSSSSLGAVVPKVPETSLHKVPEKFGVENSVWNSSQPPVPAKCVVFDSLYTTGEVSPTLGGTQQLGSFQPDSSPGDYKSMDGIVSETLRPSHFAKPSEPENEKLLPPEEDLAEMIGRQLLSSDPSELVESVALSSFMDSEPELLAEQPTASFRGTSVLPSSPASNPMLPLLKSKVFGHIMDPSSVLQFESATRSAVPVRDGDVIEGILKMDVDNFCSNHLHVPGAIARLLLSTDAASSDTTVKMTHKPLVHYPDPLLSSEPPPPPTGHSRQSRFQFARKEATASSPAFSSYGISNSSTQAHFLGDLRSFLLSGVEQAPSSCSPGIQPRFSELVSSSHSVIAVARESVAFHPDAPPSISSLHTATPTVSSGGRQSRFQFARSSGARAEPAGGIVPSVASVDQFGNPSGGITSKFSFDHDSSPSLNSLNGDAVLGLGVSHHHLPERVVVEEKSENPLAAFLSASTGPVLGGVSGRQNAAPGGVATGRRSLDAAARAPPPGFGLKQGNTISASTIPPATTGFQRSYNGSLLMRDGGDFASSLSLPPDSSLGGVSSLSATLKSLLSASQMNEGGLGQIYGSGSKMAFPSSHPNGDLEFMDPAIMAVGKGALLNNDSIMNNINGSAGGRLWQSLNSVSTGGSIGNSGGVNGPNVSLQSNNLPPFSSTLSALLAGLN